MISLQAHRKEAQEEEVNLFIQFPIPSIMSRNNSPSSLLSPSPSQT
jgi:hypothetical protein